jgi:hypothetical protein
LSEEKKGDRHRALVFQGGGALGAYEAAPINRSIKKSAVRKIQMIGCNIFLYDRNIYSIYAPAHVDKNYCDEYKHKTQYKEDCTCYITTIATTADNNFS